MASCKTCGRAIEQRAGKWRHSEPLTNRAEKKHDDGSGVTLTPPEPK